MALGVRMDEQNAVNICSGILFIVKKLGNTVTCATWMNFEDMRPVTRQMLYDSSSVWHLEWSNPWGQNRMVGAKEEGRKESHGLMDIESQICKM